jgi:hybrid cluster-associated redox disulfide protein
VADLTADMLVCDVLESHPETAPVFTRLGLGCPSCLGASMDTLESAASMHGVSIEGLLAGLSEATTAGGDGR